MCVYEGERDGRRKTKSEKERRAYIIRVWKLWILFISDSVNSDN